MPKPTISQQDLYDMLICDYATGSLSASENLLIDIHLDLNPNAQDKLHKYDTLGGDLIERATPEMVSKCCFENVMDALDECCPCPSKKAKRQQHCQSMPHSLGKLLDKQDFCDLRWKNLHNGIEVFNIPLCHRRQQTLRLVRVAPGVHTPQHHHKGREITLILDGRYDDEYGTYKSGDIAIIDDPDVIHGPNACQSKGCIALTITDAPLQFEQNRYKLINLFTRF